MSSSTPFYTPPPPLVYQDGVPPYHNAHGVGAAALGPSPPAASQDAAAVPLSNAPLRLEAAARLPPQQLQQQRPGAPSSAHSSLTVSRVTSLGVDGRSGAAPANAPHEAVGGATSASYSTFSTRSAEEEDSAGASVASTASLMSAPTAASRRRQHTPPPPPSPPSPPPKSHIRSSAAGAFRSVASTSAPVSRALIAVRGEAEALSNSAGVAASEGVPLPSLVAQQRDRIYTLVQERDGARAEQQELRDLFQRLHDDYGAASQEAAARELQLSSLGSEHAAQSEELRLLRASHARQQQRIQAFEAEWLEHSKHLRDQLDAVGQERDAVQAQRDACMSDGTDLRRQLLQLQAELHRAEAAHRDALRQQAEAHAQELRTALQEKDAQLQTRVEATRREARLVQQSLHELDAGQSASSEEREMLRWRLAETEAMANKKELLRAELERTVQHLRARLGEAEETARQDAHRQTQRAEELERLYRNQVHHEQQRAQTLLDDLAAARKATQEALRQHEALQQRCSEEASEAAVRSAKQEEAWRQQLHRVRAELEDAQARAVRHEAAAQRRQRELETLTAASHGTQEAHEKLQQAHAAQSQQLSRAEGSVRVLQAQLREKEREAELLRCAMEQATWTREMRQAAQHTLASLLGVPRVSVVGRSGVGIRERRVRGALNKSSDSGDDERITAGAAATELVDEDAPAHGAGVGNLDARAGAAPALQLEWASPPSHPAGASRRGKSASTAAAEPRRADAPSTAAASVAPPPRSATADTASARADLASPPRPSAAPTQSSDTGAAGAPGVGPHAETIERTAPRDSSADARDGEAEERQRWAAASTAALSHPFLQPPRHAAHVSATQSTPSRAPSPLSAAPPLHPGTPRVSGGGLLHRSAPFAQPSPLRTLAYTPISGGGALASTSAAAPLNAAAVGAAAGATSLAGGQATPRRGGSPRPFTSPLRARPSAGHAYNIPDARDDGPLPREGFLSASAAVGDGSTLPVGAAGAATQTRGAPHTGHVDVYFDDFLGPSSARRGRTPTMADARADRHRHAASASAWAAPGAVQPLSRTPSSQAPAWHGQERALPTEDCTSVASSTPRAVLRHQPSAAAAVPGARAAQLLATLTHNAAHEGRHSRSGSRNGLDHAHSRPAITTTTTTTDVSDQNSDGAALQQYLHDMVQQVLTSRSGSGAAAPHRPRAGGAPAGNVTADLDDDFGSASRPRSVLAAPAHRTGSASADTPSPATNAFPRVPRVTAAPQPAGHAQTDSGSSSGGGGSGGGGAGSIAATLQRLAERQQHLLQSLAAPQPVDALGPQLQRLLHGDAWGDLAPASADAASQAMIAALALSAGPAAASGGSAHHTPATAGTELAASLPERPIEAASAADPAHEYRPYAVGPTQREDEAADIDLDPRQLSYSTTVNTATTQYSAAPAPTQHRSGYAPAAQLMRRADVGGEGAGQAHEVTAPARAQHGTSAQPQPSALQGLESMLASGTLSEVASAPSVPSVSAVSSLTQLSRRLAAPFA